MQWIMFTKHLQAYPIAQAADAVKSLGLDGLDLTVRPGGHVEPANAEQDLPGVFALAKSKGLTIPLLTTAITSAADPYAETIFRLAAELGAPYLKLGYWRYRGFGHMAQQIAEAQRDLDGIEKLARRYGVAAAVHTHSGDFMTASGPVVAQLLQDRDPQAIVAYADPRHLFTEGGLAGWKMSLDLLAPRIKLIAIKDVIWIPQPDAKLGKMRWVAQTAPLNVGIVAWPEVFACLRQAGFDGVVSMHAEYQGADSWRDLTTEQVVQQTRADLEYLWDVTGGK